MAEAQSQHLWFLEAALITCFMHSMPHLADVVGEAEAGEGLGEAQNGEQGACGCVAVGHLRLRLLLPHLRIHCRHILCTHTL